MIMLTCIKWLLSNILGGLRGLSWGGGGGGGLSEDKTLEMCSTHTGGSYSLGVFQHSHPEPRWLWHCGCHCGSQDLQVPFGRGIDHAQARFSHHLVAQSLDAVHPRVAPVTVTSLDVDLDNCTEGPSNTALCYYTCQLLHWQHLMIWNNVCACVCVRETKK